MKIVEFSGNDSFRKRGKTLENDLEVRTKSLLNWSQTKRRKKPPQDDRAQQRPERREGGGDLHVDDLEARHGEEPVAHHRLQSCGSQRDVGITQVRWHRLYSSPVQRVGLERLLVIELRCEFPEILYKKLKMSAAIFRKTAENASKS